MHSHSFAIPLPLPQPLSLYPWGYICVRKKCGIVIAKRKEIILDPDNDLTLRMISSYFNSWIEENKKKNDDES